MMDKDAVVMRAMHARIERLEGYRRNMDRYLTASPEVLRLVDMAIYDAYCNLRQPAEVEA